MNNVGRGFGLTTGHKRIVAVLLAMTMLLFSAMPAAAYKNGAWVWKKDGSNYNVLVCLHPNFDGPNGGWNMVSSQHYALSRAIDTWNSVPGELTFVKTDTPCATLESLNVRYLQIGWTENDDATSYAYFTTVQSATGCETTFTLGCIWQGAIWLESPNINWYYINDAPYPTGPSQPYYGAIDYKSLVTHELGHAAGLGHNYPWDDCMATMAGDNMCFVWWSGVARSLAQDDWNGYEAFWNHMP